MPVRPRPLTGRHRARSRVAGPYRRGLVAFAAVALAVAVLLAGCLADGETKGLASSSNDDAAPATFPASDVLRDWDAARSRAFAAGDVRALRSLYVDGSAAGTTDVRLLRAYVARGLRIEGMDMQLIAVDVLHRDSLLLRLRVTDRLTGAVAVGPRTRMRLPADRASTRVLELRRAGRDQPWRVASVRSAPWRASR